MGYFTHCCRLKPEASQQGLLHIVSVLEVFYIDIFMNIFFEVVSLYHVLYEAWLMIACLRQLIQTVFNLQT